MPTLNQLIKIGRHRKLRKTLVPALSGNPQRKGVCIKVYTTKPKKPNSSQRKVAKVSLSNGRSLLAAIPGHGHNLQVYSTVLVRGGRCRDLPGVHYKLIRNKYDFRGLENRLIRKKRRSKFSVPKIV